MFGMVYHCMCALFHTDLCIYIYIYVSLYIYICIYCFSFVSPPCSWGRERNWKELEQNNT